MSEQYNSTEVSYKNLRTEINKLRLKYQLTTGLNGLMLWITSLILLFIAWFFLGGMLNLPATLRIIGVASWLICIVVFGYLYLARSLIKRINIEQMAFKIEQIYPELQDRLISSLQLWKLLSNNIYGYSENFIRMIINESHSFLNKIDKSKVLSENIGKLKRSTLIMLLSFIPVVILITIFPSTFNNSINAFMNPIESAKLLNHVEIKKVIPGDCIIQPGDNVEIKVELTGNPQSEPKLYYRSEKIEWVMMTGNYDNLSSTSSFIFNNIRESLKYYISLNEIKTREYSIKVIEKPIISNLSLELNYPKYMGLQKQSLGVNVGDISAPLGTSVTISAESNKDLASAFIVFDDETKTRLNIKNSNNITGKFIVKRSGKYHISITDIDGTSNTEPIEYSIIAIPDQPPKVNIIYPGMNIDLGQDMIVPLQINVLDDHGISKITLHYQVNEQDRKEIISLANYDNQQTNATIKYTWNLDPLRLFPEDVVSYYVEASDFDNVSGPNIGRSSVFTARYPSLYEIYKKAESEQQDQESTMEEILSQQDEVKKTVDNIIKELKTKNEINWSTQKELEKASTMQEKIDDQMKNLSKQIEETMKKIEENPLIGTKLLEKIQEIKDLVNELFNEDMKQILRKLSEALEKVDPSQQMKDLIAARMQQEEFMEKLDRIIDLFKNIRFKQQLESAINQVKELIQKQTEIKEESEQLTNNPANINERSKQLSDRETRVKNQTEQIQRDLDSITEEIKERVPNLGAIMEQINNTLKKEKVTEQMEQASQELRNNNPIKSIPYQKNAISSLTKFQNSMQNIMETLENQNADEIITALKETARKSLYISHKQEEIIQTSFKLNREIEKMLPAEKEIVDSLAVDQIRLSEMTRKVSEALKELSHKNSAINLKLVWDLEMASDSMRRSAKAMEDKQLIISDPIQKSSLAMINKAIAEMLDSIDRINSQAMPMMGLDDYMEQLRQLAEQQSQLNQSTQQAESQMRKQGITPSLEELLEKLAAEQALVKEATERLATKLEQMAEKMGDLNEVAREMQEVANELRQGMIERQTIEKQKRILTRLLEYEKAMKKQDFDKKREAQVGRDYLAEKPSTELPDDAVKIKKQLDTMLTPSSQAKWPIQYREQIKMYYKALSNIIKTPTGASK